MAGFGRGACTRFFKAVCITAVGGLAAACNTGGNGNDSAAIAPLPVPTGLAAVAVSANQVDLSWTGGGGGTSGYRIAYKAGDAAPPDCKTGTLISPADITGQSHSVVQLQADTAYSFTVCAVDGSTQVSAPATPVSATTLAGPPDPQTPQAVVKSSSEIDLSWTGGGGTTAGYQIAYAVHAAPVDCYSGVKLITADSINGTAKPIPGLGGGVTYGFRICAVDARAIASVSRGIAILATTYSLSQSTVTLAAPDVPVGGTDRVDLTLRDSGGNPLALPGFNVTFRLSNGTSDGGFGPVTDNGDGTYTATFTGSTSGTASRVIAVINGEALTTPAPTVQVDAGPVDPAHSTIALNPPAPASILEGQTVGITVAARDADGNGENAGGATVGLSLGGGSGAATGVLSPVTDGGNGSYTATFTATGAGTPVTVSATIDGTAVAGTSPAPSIAVGRCTVTQLVWTRNPNALRTAGQDFTTGEVQLQDANGDACGIAPVTFTLDTTGAALDGTATVTPFGAAADMTQANIQRAGTYHIIAQTGGVSSAPSTAVTVNAGQAAQLAFTHLPAAWHTGAANSVQLALEDPYGNVAGDVNGGSVALSLAAAPAGGGTLSGTSVAALSGNFATFQGLFIDAPGSGYRLSATTGGFQVTSDLFEVDDNPGLDLQVPIELADGALGNLAGTGGVDVAPTTETSFDPAAYDGDVGVYFEIVATNTGTQSGVVTLDAGCGASAVSGSAITVPAGATAATRYRSPALTLAAGHYCVDTPRLPTADALTVHAARLIVAQHGAHITKVYVPLLSYAGIIDADNGIDSVGRSVSSYIQPTPDRYAIWQDDTGALVGVAANGYTFEMLAQGRHTGSASVALVDRTRDTVIVALSSGLDGGVHFASASFDGNTAPQFKDGDAYEVRMRGGAADGNLYKAGVWIQLEDLSAYTTYWRTGRATAQITTSTIVSGSRQQLVTDAFSNPSVDFACTMAVSPDGASAVLDLVDVAGPTGTSPAQSVPGSSLTINTPTKSLVTATGLTGLVSGDDYLSRVANVSAGTLDLTQCLARVHGP